MDKPKRVQNNGEDSMLRMVRECIAHAQTAAERANWQRLLDDILKLRAKHSGVE